MEKEIFMIRKKIIFLSLFFIFSLRNAPFSRLLHADPIPPKMAETGVLFSYEGADAKSVTLGAEFNGWDMQKNPLTKEAASGIWSTTVQLGEGHYEYKFIIDGEWMSGANLVIEIKKDSQGKLYIPEPKAPPNTPYSGKIRFGGNMIGLMNTRYFAEEDRYRLEKPRFHIDMDWDVTITKEVNGFIRTELDSFETNQLSLNLFKSHLDITPQWFNLRLFNNEKDVQFDDPLRLTDKEISLRYDTLELFDEPNLNRGIGLKTQGLTFNASPLGWLDLQGFYIDKSNLSAVAPFAAQGVNNVEDNYGVRLKRMFGEILGLGFSYFVRTGIVWPYADSNNFFPDPTTQQGHSFDSAFRLSNLSDGKGAEFFKGWRDQTNTAFDLKFRAFPDFWIFSEYLSKSDELKSVRRNGRASLDLPSDVRWKLFDQNQFLLGGQARWLEKFSLEAFWSRKEITLGSALHTDQNTEFSSKGNQYGGKARFDYKENNKKISVGVVVTQENNDPLGPGAAGSSVFVDDQVFPTQKRFRFANFISSSPTNILEADLNFQPFVKLDFGERFQAKIFGNFHRYTFRSFTTVSGVALSNPSVSPSFKVTNQEAIADYSAQISGPFFLQGSVRYSRFRDLDVSNASGQFWSTYSALVYKLRKNIFVRLGWGVDPEGFDEDLKEDFDLREEFLYNRFTEALGKGESVSQSLVTAEKALEAEKRISLRIEIKF